MTDEANDELSLLLVVYTCWLPFECRCKEFSIAIRRSGAMPRLIESLPALPFEARKDVSQVLYRVVATG